MRFGSNASAWTRKAACACHAEPPWPNEIRKCQARRRAATASKVSGATRVNASGRTVAGVALRVVIAVAVIVALGGIEVIGVGAAAVNVAVNPRPALSQV